jgi:hypothetical protein
VLEYLERAEIIIFPEAGHFPELEDPERLKSLLANEDLWNGLRLSQPGRPAEVGQDMKHDGSSTMSCSVDDAGSPRRLVPRRKRFDSNL